ncbi:MAG: SMC-Scp complex subunit ScpB [Chloroflexi bacterium]|nr:SMC-Scp complex subunit ScpB [Chloroflexota bacterium]
MSEEDHLVMLVESLLFVASEPAAIRRLAQALDVTPRRVEKALDRLEQELHRRGIRLQRHNDAVQLVTAPEASDVIETYLGLDLTTRLSRAALETLAIIAYRQPITRPQLEAIRGVSCDGVLRTLLNRGLVEEVGRLEQAGRPILYGTTFAFLQYFGLASLDELPPLEEDIAAALEARAEGEESERSTPSASDGNPISIM